jgi:hypothetical protein
MNAPARTAAAVALACLAAGVILILAMPGASNQPGRVSKLKNDMDKLRPLHKKLGSPRPGDWLYHHREAGQTFEEYLRCEPVGKASEVGR